MKVLFVEPPKDFWFILGQYIPPPFGVLALAGYLEANYDAEIEVLDCQAEGLNWESLERRLESIQPDVLAPSGLSTSNAFVVLRAVQLAKKLNPGVRTVVGGQHFTALAEETLKGYPEVDVVVRGEGEETLLELVKELDGGGSLSDIKGISYRRGGEVLNNPDRPLICDLGSLPEPGYHFVERYMKDYYFSLMAEKGTPFAIVEGSRGCGHACSYCSQSPFWRRNQRVKSPKRVVDEMEHIHEAYGSGFFWFTDDNFALGDRAKAMGEEMIARGLTDVTWFCQARCDDIVRSREHLPLLRRAGNTWMLVGLDTPSLEVLQSFRRDGLDRSTAKESVDLLRKNGIFSQGTFIIGERSDTHESVAALREYADWVDPDIATFMALTPFPGTDIFEEARARGWIEDWNWANYDMVHAIMPTEHLSRAEVQEELYSCYDGFFGSWPRRFKSLSSENPYTRRTYQYLARQAILTGLRRLF